MGMFGRIVLNELKKNGEEVKDKENEDPSYSMDDGEEKDIETPVSSEDDTVPDYSMGNADEETPEGETPPEGDTETSPDEGEIPDDAATPASSEDDTVPDYSMGDTDTPEDNETTPEGENPPVSSEDDTVPDYSMGDTDTPEGENPPVDGETETPDGGGDDTNYSMDDPGAGEETTTDDTATGETPEQTPDEGMQQIEADINKGLSDQEIDIRNVELKKKYVELFNIVKGIISRLESVSKTEENAATIDFISDKSIELKQMIFDYLDTTYATQTYIKNYATHQEYLAVLTGIKKLFDEIKPKNKDDKQK